MDKTDYSMCVRGTLTADPTDHRFKRALERFYDGRLDEQSVALLAGR